MSKFTEAQDLCRQQFDERIKVEQEAVLAVRNLITGFSDAYGVPLQNLSLIKDGKKAAFQGAVWFDDEAEFWTFQLQISFFDSHDTRTSIEFFSQFQFYFTEAGVCIGAGWLKPEEWSKIVFSNPSSLNDFYAKFWDYILTEIRIPFERRKGHSK